MVEYLFCFNLCQFVLSSMCRVTKDSLLILWPVASSRIATKTVTGQKGTDWTINFFSSHQHSPLWNMTIFYFNNFLSQKVSFNKLVLRPTCRYVCIYVCMYIYLIPLFFFKVFFLTSRFLTFLPWQSCRKHLDHGI